MHRKMTTSLHAAVTAVLLLACGGGGGGGDDGKGGGGAPSGATSQGCNYTRLGACFDYTDMANVSGFDWDGAKRGCSDQDGVWEPCPTNARTGTCEVRQSGLTLKLLYYPGVLGCSPEEAEEDCRLSNPGKEITFTDGAGTCSAGTSRTLTCKEEDACQTYTGLLEPERASSIEDLCVYQEGTVGSACPSSSLASCTLAVTADLTSVVRYYSAAQLSDAQVRCSKLGGTWALEP